MSKQTFRIGKNSIPNILVSSCSVILFLFAAFILATPVTQTTNAEPAAPAEEGTSLVTNKTIEATVHPEGESTLSIIKDTVIGSTSAQYGYEIYISVDSDTTNAIYLNCSSTHDEVGTRISATAGTYDTPIALDITDGATWGYAIAGLGSFDATYDEANPSATAKFAAMPTIGNEQLIHDAIAPTSDDAVDIYYGINLDSELESGIYKTKILYTVIPRTTRPCSGICYDANGGTGTMNDQSATINSNVVLSAPYFSRSGYGFAGWNTAADGTGAMYGPNETITMPADILWLYATWIEAEQNVTLQTFNQNDSTYTNAAVGTMIALEDERDGQVYAVAKLADNNWWMIENLRLNLSTYGDQIDAGNTNNPASTFVTAVNTKPASSSVWCEESSAACIDQVAYNANNVVGEGSGARNIYGVYYNWYTATAGNGAYAQASGDAAGDICPAGWHLPTGGANGDFYNLNYAINGNANITDNSLAIRAYPNNFSYAGYYYGSGIVARSAAGSYWSSTARSVTNAYRLGFNSSRISPGLEDSGDGKQYGRTIRCIANQTSTTYTLNYDANTGSGAPVSQNSTNTHRSYVFRLSNTAPTLSGYDFLGWSTSSAATTAEYQPGDEIVITDANAAITLYAVWASAKAILGSNNNLNFVYDSNIYTIDDIYTDNRGDTTIVAVYDVPLSVTSEDEKPQWTENSNIQYVNFDSSFVDFKPANTAYWFYKVYELTHITNANNFDTSNVISMSHMFERAGVSVQAVGLVGLFIDDIGVWNVGNVQDMSYMFYDAAGEVSDFRGLSNWNVGNVRDMSYMFAEAASRKVKFFEADFSNWNVGNVTNMGHMFDHTGGNGTIVQYWRIGDLGNWNVSNVRDMSYMFYHTLASKDYGNPRSYEWYIGDISGWNVSSVTNMSYMFAHTAHGVGDWNIGDLSGWNVSRVTDMSYMFNGTAPNALVWDIGNLGYVDTEHPGWDVSSVTNMSHTFAGAATLNSTTWNIGDISGWTVTNVTDHTDFINLNANSTNASVVNNQPNWP